MIKRSKFDATFAAEEDLKKYNDQVRLDHVQEIDSCSEEDSEDDSEAED